MTTRLHALFALPLALVTAAGWPQPPVSVELHHRSAESLITVLRPLIGPATLAGAGMQMQVLAPPSDLARVVRLIEQSDRPLRPLVVTLREDPPAIAEAQAPARSGSVTLSTGRPLPADPNGNGQELSSRSGPHPTRVVEGDPLLISMPASQSLWFGTNRGGTGAKNAASRDAGGNPASGVRPGVAGVVHFDAVSDFTARIWLAGETVAIDLQPRAAGRVDGAADSSLEPVTVYGRLGQWIALADSATALPLNSAAPSGEPGAGLWIRVDAERPPAVGE